MREAAFAEPPLIFQIHDQRPLIHDQRLILLPELAP
jgi:hypothetical protein